MKISEDFKEFISQFEKIVRQSETFLIMPHIRMDGDALGSSIALHQVLEEMGKKPFIYTTDQVANIYNFLPRLDTLSYELPDKQFDCAILVECPNYDRCPAGKKFKAKIQVNIDHHPDNDYYADLNWVDTEASSVGELFFLIFERLGYPMLYETILGLYVAIFTDTGAFQYSKTTHKTHHIVAEMLKRFDLPLEEIGRKVYIERDISVMRLLGSLMMGTRIIDDGFAVTMMPRSMMNEFNVKDADAQNLVRDLNIIRGVHTVAFLRETKEGKAKVSLRSSEIPVNKIAGKFGGGGHAQAAGCTLNTSLEDAKEKIVNAVRDMLAGKKISA